MTGPAFSTSAVFCVPAAFSIPAASAVLPVPAALLRAYRRTEYSAGPVVVRIGQRSASARSLLRDHRIRHAVFLTAWNPMSHRIPDGLNHRLQHRLHARLRRWPTLEGEGSWRCWREEHVLALAPAAPMIVLARRFRQRAVVVLHADGSAVLVMLQGC